MYTSRMFDMWSNVTSKFEGHTSLQTNVQTNGGQTQSSGSIKGKDLFFYFFKLFITCVNNRL